MYVLRAFALLVAGLASVVAHAAPLGPDGERGRTHPGKFVWYDLTCWRNRATQVGVNGG